MKITRAKQFKSEVAARTFLQDLREFDYVEKSALRYRVIWIENLEKLPAPDIDTLVENLPEP